MVDSSPRIQRTRMRPSMRNDPAPAEGYMRVEAPEARVDNQHSDAAVSGVNTGTFPGAGRC